MDANKQLREHGTLELEQILFILIHNGSRCRFVIFPLEQIGVDVEVAASAVLEERYGTAQICQTVPTLRQQLVGMTVARYVLHGRGQLRNARLQHHVNERG